ncbi:MAG: hypothetical protein AAF513_01110 [Pseudomonadota bacterium]
MLNALLEQALPEGAQSEAQYKSQWRSHVADVDDPFAAAVTGGLMADRFAWVFSGGYQGAMRAVFPNVKFAGWGAFAVSEDRSGEMPWVNWAASDAGFVIDGYKTWIAASDVVDQILFKAGRGGSARFFVVHRGHAGLTLTSKEKPGFLPDLSQGIARFESLLLGEDALLDTTRVPMFGTLEVLFIYIAFLAASHRRYADQRTAAYEALTLAQGMVADWVPRDDLQFKSLDHQVQSILRDISARHEAENPDWQRDKKLIEMYHRE